MNLESIAEKIIPTLILTLIFAVITIFQEVDRNTENIKRLEKQGNDRLKYVIENHDILIEIKAKYLDKEIYYKEKK